MKPRCAFVVLLIILGLALSPEQKTRVFLSDLSGTDASPLYSSYAARIEHSEFMLDKGYHFVFYDSTRGADFTNEMAGDICVGFKTGSD
jgi:hypothetical protein